MVRVPRRNIGWSEEFCDWFGGFVNFAIRRRAVADIGLSGAGENEHQPQDRVRPEMLSGTALSRLWR